MRLLFMLLLSSQVYGNGNGYEPNFSFLVNGNEVENLKKGDATSIYRFKVREITYPESFNLPPKLGFEIGQKVVVKIPYITSFLCYQPSKRDSVLLAYASIIREARILTALSDCPNIVKMYNVAGVNLDDHGVSDVHTLGLLMENIDGSTLEESTKKRSKTEIAMIFDPLVSAIRCAHKKKILHDDISLSNIMLTQNDNNLIRPKVIDWADAKEFGYHQNQNPPITQDKRGTPIFFSPEKFTREQNVYDPKSDIWSLGIVLYYLCTGGSFPFGLADKTTSLAELPKILREQELTTPLNLPLWCQSRIEKMLAKDPKQRMNLEDYEPITISP